MRTTLFRSILLAAALAAPVGLAAQSGAKADSAGTSHDAMPKDGMAKDGMAKNGMAKDGMAKDAMKHGAMGKDAMGKDAMGRMENDGMKHGRMATDGMSKDAMDGGSTKHDAMSHDAMGHDAMEKGGDGMFAGATGDAASGDASIENSGGKRELVFTSDFALGAADDVHVVLSPDETRSSGALDLGKLRSARGAQRYAIPADADLSRYSYVLLWSKKANAAVATAELARGHGAMHY
jgi:pentapeptide MXKDX repeat protein